MDRFLIPEKFDADPHSPTVSQEWNYWLKAFENFAASFVVLEDANKLSLLTNNVSHTVYKLIAEHTVYKLIAEKESHAVAVEALKAIIVKPVNEIFARYKFTSQKQLPEESIDQYHQALQLVSKNSEFAAVDAETHGKTYVRDAFNRGITSHQIRLGLLEFNTLTLDEAVGEASALESPKNQSVSYSFSEANLNASTVPQDGEQSTNLAAKS